MRKNKSYIALFLGFGLLVSAGCATQLKRNFAAVRDVQYFSGNKAAPITTRNNISIRSLSGCNDPMNYVPDTNHLDHTPWKYIRVNFHWVNSSDSSSNYRGEYAKKVVKSLLVSANKDLKENNKLWLPYGNNIPVISTRLQYVLTPHPDDPSDDGIYEHYDDELCFYIHKGRNRNLASRSVMNKYGVQKDTVLNVFIMPHHPDSVASKTYTSYGVGVALRNFVKIAGPFEMKNAGWAHRGNFNHEVAHILGLQHAWLNDGCDDTPRHSLDCWNRTEEPPCDKQTSNNMMDYNAFQHALSPCQIGKMHANIAREYSNARKFILPTWCELKADKTITIQDSIVWKGAKDLEGHLIIANSGQLAVNCRLSLPKNAKISIEPTGKLVLNPDAKLHNACGDQWQGIEIQEKGKQKGALVIIGDPVIADIQNTIE